MSEVTPSLQPSTIPLTSSAVTAEPGTSTSEYGLTTKAGAVLGAVNAALGLAVSLGAHVSSAQWGAIGGFEGSMVALVGAYTVSRGIRKAGTSG